MFLHHFLYLWYSFDYTMHKILQLHIFFPKYFAKIHLNFLSIEHIFLYSLSIPRKNHKLYISYSYRRYSDLSISALYFIFLQFSLLDSHDYPLHSYWDLIIHCLMIEDIEKSYSYLKINWWVNRLKIQCFALFIL